MKRCDSGTVGLVEAYTRAVAAMAEVEDLKVPEEPEVE
jgi:hypothetical protein